MDLISFLSDSSVTAVILKALIGALTFCIIGTLVIFCCVFRSRKSNQKFDDIENQSTENLLHKKMVEELESRIGNRKKFIEFEANAKNEKVLKFTLPVNRIEATQCRDFVR